MRRPELLLACLLLGACAGSPERVSPSNNEISDAVRMNLALAENYLAKGDLDKATERVELALRSDPGAAQAHALRAVLHERAGDTAQAERSFDRALQLAPRDGTILNAHAAWLCEHGQAERADREFVLALADDGYHMPMQALANAGKCALAANRLPQAEDYLRRALVFSPKEPTLLSMLADLELRMGKTLEARAFIQRREALGADAATLDLAARIEQAAGDPQAEARLRARLREEFPEYVPTGEGVVSP